MLLSQIYEASICEYSGPLLPARICILKSPPQRPVFLSNTHSYSSYFSLLFCSRIKVPLFACTEAALFPLPEHLTNDHSVICSAQFLPIDIQIITHLFCSFPPELSTVPLPSFLLEWNRWTGRNPCVWKQVWGLVCSFFFFFGLTRHAENRFESNCLEKGNTNFKSLVALIQSDT